MDDMTPNERLRESLNERGIKYDVVDNDLNHRTFWDLNGIRYEYSSYDKSDCGCLSISCANFITPEQAIAATVGNGTDLSKRLREVHGLHAFAELFGFDWHDESDWDWHDVACAMADAIDATVGVGTCRYVPERTASIVSVPHKDYISIGHYECGLCGASITPVMRYCHGCGAKLEGVSE